MVQISHTSSSRKALRIYISTTSSNQPLWDPALQSPSIDHTNIAKIAMELSSQDPLSKPRYCLDVLLLGTSIYTPEPPPKARPSAEYLALMERLRHEQEENEYAAMVGTVGEKAGIDLITKDVSDQISVILNILFSSIFTGLAVWYATSNLSTYRNREPIRVGGSVAVAIVVAVAEVVVYNSYIRKIEDAKTRERSTTEVKALLGKNNKTEAFEIL
ncbi:hypothetical protein ABW20_dc0109669 [Dactylellina cionopaga]|nr:hypothetical protein ABW20_dc0109669 [Dactylellina cionopaga]